MLDGVRQQKQDIKIVLRLAGCSPDEMNTTVLSRADLTLSSDLPESDVLAKLDSLWK